MGTIECQKMENILVVFEKQASSWTPYCYLTLFPQDMYCTRKILSSYSKVVVKIAHIPTCFSSLFRPPHSGMQHKQCPVSLPCFNCKRIICVNT